MKQGIRLHLDANGRVVIPSPVRKALQVRAGDELILEKKDEGFFLTTQQHRIQRAQRRAQRYVETGASLSEELVAERRKGAKNE